MKIISFLIFSIYLFYSCSPINKQHGYLLEDMINTSGEISEFNEGSTTQNDIFISLGSPSIQIDDINNIWIYLVSVKENNVFEKDDIVFQSIIRFEFDKNGTLLSKTFSDQEDFTDISFSKDKTTVSTDNYGITEQIYETFTRTTGQ